MKQDDEMELKSLRKTFCQARFVWIIGGEITSSSEFPLYPSFTHIFCRLPFLFLLAPLFPAVSLHLHFYRNRSDKDRGRSYLITMQITLPDSSYQINFSNNHFQHYELQFISSIFACAEISCKAFHSSRTTIAVSTESPMDQEKTKP